MKKRLISIPMSILALFLLMMFTAPSVMSEAYYPFPDTGQFYCYNSGHNETYCDSIQPGEFMYGQDGHYQPRLPRSYSKLGYGGVELSDDERHVDHGGRWIMTRDNITGLIWEVKTNDNKDETYNWQDAKDQFIPRLNNEEFGGFDNWRVPNRQELASLVNRGLSYRAINTDYFPNTVYRYWSATTSSSSTSDAWVVGFLTGSVNTTYEKSDSFYVRAVRGGQITSNFVDNGDGTVTDTTTGLMWQQNTAPGTYQWSSALSYAENLELAGYDDWRLPNINELQTLVDDTAYRPATYRLFLPYTSSSNYWSSTTYDSRTDGKWVVGFTGGGVGWSTVRNTFRVRAVRGGHSTIGALVVNSTRVNNVDITASPSDYGGTTNYTHTNIPNGTQITLTAPTTHGSARFSSWSGCDSTSTAERTCSVTIDGDQAVTVNYVWDTYTISLSASPSEGGAVSGGGTYDAGEQATVSAQANDGYEFVNWTEGGSEVSTSSSYSFTVSSNRTLVANFNEIPSDTYTISLSASPSDGGTVSGGGTYEQGQRITVRAQANDGYTFVNWTEGGSEVSTSSSYGFTVSSNRTLVANFNEIPSDTYTISLSASPFEGGTVTGEGTFEDGQRVTVSAQANDGYTFVNWTEGGSEVSTSSSYSFTVNADRYLTANFNQAGDDFGSLRVNILPSEAVEAGAQWRRVDTGTWYNSGYREAGIPSGTYYVEFRSIEGWQTPDNQEVAISEGRTTVIWPEYTREEHHAAYIIGAFPSGIRYFNPQSRAWVDWFPFTGTTAIVATDLDNDGTDDLIGVWPGSGMWAYQSSIDDWQLLTTYFPEKMSTGDMTGNGQEDIIASWSQFGAYYRDSVSGSWPQLVGLAPDTFDAGDITGDGFDQFVGSWEGYGIYTRDRNDNWVHLTTVHTPVLAVGDMTGDGRADIPCSWPEWGVYYMNSTTGTWEWLHDNHAELLTTGDISGDGNEELVAVFDDGVWVYYQEANTWERISQDRPSAITTGMVFTQDGPFQE